MHGADPTGGVSLGAGFSAGPKTAAHAARTTTDFASIARSVSQQPLGAGGELRRLVERCCEQG